MAYEDLTVTIKTLDRYLDASKHIKSFVETNIRDLTVKATESDRSFYSASGRIKCCAHMKESLTRFALKLMHMPRIKAFRLVLFVCFEVYEVRDSHYFTSMSTLLSGLPATLSSLTIDNGGRPSSPTPGRQVERNHFCSLLLNKSFMPSLRHLRIRARNICPEIFQPICSDHHSQLESLIINLSLVREDSQFSKIFYAHYCLAFQSDGKDLYSRIVEAAKTCIPRLSRLTMLRIMCHKFPSGDLASFDVLSDQHFIHPSNLDWSVDYGELDPHYDERSDDSFSTTDSVEELPW